MLTHANSGSQKKKLTWGKMSAARERIGFPFFCQNIGTSGHT